MCMKWYHLGLQLKVSVGTLDRIRAEFSSYGDQLLEMLKIWLTTADNPSWGTLTNALRSRGVGERRIADILMDKYYQMEDKHESKHYA